MLNVLIVDDDKNLCECLLRLIPWDDMNCNIPVAVYNGLEAWEFLQREKVDFIICDLKMPVMEGIELCRRIYEKKWKIDIVFLSAYEDFSIARKALQYGVTDYILKPVNRESLNNLEKIIHDVNQNKIKKVLSNKFFDEEYNKQIFDAICSQDISFLHSMFENLKVLGDQEVINSGISLLRILHDFLCAMNRSIDRGAYDAILKKWRAEFIKLDDKEKRIDFLFERYQSEMEQPNVENEVEYTVQRIRKLAEEHFADSKCNVAWIAEKLHMTSGYVGRIFNRSTGIGLMEYITEQRMKEACRLLSEEYVSVSKIAEQVGYTDANYFTKAFRNKIGMSPSEYRKKNNLREK